MTPIGDNVRKNVCWNGSAATQHYHLANKKTTYWSALMLRGKTLKTQVAYVTTILITTTWPLESEP